MNQISAAKPRRSGIELLRIFAIMMVVTGHYLSKGILNSVPFGSFNTIAARAIEAVAVVGVNCFLLISGYFGIKNKGIHLRRLVNMLLMVAFYSVGSYLFYCVRGEDSFALSGFLKAFAPYLFGGYWFIRVYLVLMLLTPFLNAALVQLTKKAYTALLALCLLLFSLLPSFLPAFQNENGFDILHFVVMYVIGGYFQLHLRRLPSFGMSFGLFLLLAVGTCAFSIYGNGLGYWAYDFVTVLISSCFLFLAFLKPQFQSRAINFAARSTLAVFVLENNIHGLYEKLMRVKDFMIGKLFLPHLVLCVLGFTAFAIAVDCLRRFLFRYTVDRLLDRWPSLNTRLLEEVTGPSVANQ